MGDGSSLVAGDVGDAGLEEGLGYGKNAFTAKLLAIPQIEALDFFFEMPLGLSAPLGCSFCMNSSPKRSFRETCLARNSRFK